MSVFASDCINYTLEFSDILVCHVTCSSFIFSKICPCTLVYIILQWDYIHVVLSKLYHC